MIKLGKMLTFARVPADERAKLPGISDAGLEAIQHAYILEMLRSADETMKRSAAMKILARMQGKVIA